MPVLQPSGSVGLEDWEVEPFAHCGEFPSLSGLCLGSARACTAPPSAVGRACSQTPCKLHFLLGVPAGRAPGRKDGTSAMGQLCCFPFSRDEEKISKCGLYCAES